VDDRLESPMIYGKQINTVVGCKVEVCLFEVVSVIWRKPMLTRAVTGT